MLSLDRKYFFSSYYDFVLTVFDASGNQDQEILSVSLDEITISLSQANLKLTEGDICTIAADVTGLAGHSVEWTSSNPEVVKVNKDFVLGQSYSTATITALSPGNATITAKVANREAVCVVNVE